MNSKPRREQDSLQCPDCKRPDALRIRPEVDQDTAVCGYCGALVTLVDFGKERRRIAIGTMTVGLLVFAAGLVTWLYTDGWHGYFRSVNPLSGSSERMRFVDSKRFDAMPLLRVAGMFVAVCGVAVVLGGLGRFLGWGNRGR